jgi:hypothetical protein
MARLDYDFWSDLLGRTLMRYDEALLRQVASRLLRPRNQWPVPELIARGVESATNAAVIDRRLADLPPASRQALALIGHSRQPVWSLGNLVEMLMMLGHADGLQPLFTLLEAGLLFPYLADVVNANPGTASARHPAALKTFEQWLAVTSGATGLTVFTHPHIAVRAIGIDLGLPDLSDETSASTAGSQRADRHLFLNLHVSESDGLEWLLRLAVLWQQVSPAPLRRTQQGGFFKRDLERLQQDPLLNGPPADRLVDVPDPGFLLVALAEQEGLLRPVEGELSAGDLPAVWNQGLAAALESLYVALPRLTNWNPRDGWRGGDATAGNPFPSAFLLALLLLARLPDRPKPGWLRPIDLEVWLTAHHPYWKNEELRPSRQLPWLETFLLGVAYHLRLVQVARAGDGGWLVRLAPTGRWLLGLADQPDLETVYTQTLLVQPNLEIIAYRQGLTSALITRLTQFAAWKNLGAACTLQLEPETVYRALESGQTFETIRLTLEQHGTRSIPPSVLDSLRTWANKRDRITVYPSATLMEFATADDLNEALARGLPAVRVADTLAVVASEEDIEFRHFRLTGTRDYGLPPEKCVTMEPDGVTLTVDLARSDLLLETELPRFTELVPSSSMNGRRKYRLTPASLAAARASGLAVTTLEVWFHQRTGQPLSPAARMLLIGGQLPPPEFQHYLILQVASADLADGLLQWPQTSDLISSRLGPTALVVTEDQAPLLRARLREAGIEMAP